MTSPDATRPYIGLMSGTSMDGVDAVIATCHGRDHFVVHAHCHVGFDPSLRRELLALNQPGANELHRAALATNALMDAYAQATREAIAQAGAREVCALGAHGQTVRHRPQAYDGKGYTLQLMNGALLAELTGIDVVCDFRSRDVAAGGQGAPLVPGFHAAIWGRPGIARAILNIGGIANLTLLPGDGSVQGFDCGPGNVLMDAWTAEHRGQPYDNDGVWASQGNVHSALLNRLLDEPFLHRRGPKSTGRDLFHPRWLHERLHGERDLIRISDVDVQATLAAFTARTAAEALLANLPQARQLLVCGGGAHNSHLMGELQRQLPTVQVTSTQSVGIPPMQVEALAFAWLAHAFMQRHAASCPQVTGADGSRILGAHYPA